MANVQITFFISLSGTAGAELDSRKAYLVEEITVHVSNALV